MQTTTERLSGLFSKKNSRTQKQTINSSNEIKDTISMNGAVAFDFAEKLSLSEARVQLIKFSNNLSLSSIKNMEDFRSLKKLVKQMSDYLLANQYEIKKISLSEMQDYKFAFRTVQEKIRRMYQDKDFIRKIVTNDGLLTYEDAYAEEFERKVRGVYESLAIVYNAIVVTFRVDSYIPIPTDMKILDSFPESFDAKELSRNKDKFQTTLRDVDNMSHYILDNESEIIHFPAMQLFDFKITLEGIIEEVKFMLEDKSFTNPQLYNLRRLSNPDGRLYRSYNIVNDSLKFNSELPLEKAVDLISTFGHRMNTEELLQNIEQFTVFSYDMKIISEYMVSSKTNIRNLPDSVLRELIKGLEDVEERISRILLMERVQPRIVYNLNRILKKDLKKAKDITLT